MRSSKRQNNGINSTDQSSTFETLSSSFSNRLTTTSSTSFSSSSSSTTHKRPRLDGLEPNGHKIHETMTGTTTTKEEEEKEEGKEEKNFDSVVATTTAAIADGSSNQTEVITTAAPVGTSVSDIQTLQHDLEQVEEGLTQQRGILFDTSFETNAQNSDHSGRAIFDSLGLGEHSYTITRYDDVCLQQQ
jgi:hypothetical protein